MGKSGLTVIVPAYNEANNITNTIHSLRIHPSCLGGLAI